MKGALNAACELVLEKTAYGNLLERDGNRSPNVAPQGLYAAHGEEQWLAISVTTDDEWLGLVDALGRPEWALDPELASYAGRRARHDELDEHLAAVERGARRRRSRRAPGRARGPCRRRS